MIDQWTNSVGTTFWTNNNILHRLDGPAVQYQDGSVQYWMNGKLHRTDGPAVANSNGHCCWWINGIQYPNMEEHQRMVKLKAFW